LRIIVEHVQILIVQFFVSQEPVLITAFVQLDRPEHPGELILYVLEIFFRLHAGLRIRIVLVRRISF